MLVDNAYIFEVVEDSLRMNESFLKTVLSRNGDILQFLHEQFMLDNPELVVNALSDIEDHALWNTANAIPEDLWLNRDVVVAWVTAGNELPVNARNAPASVLNIWLDDRELCLAHAIHQKYAHHCSFFTKDILFMTEVVRHHPFLYVNANRHSSLPVSGFVEPIIEIADFPQRIGLFPVFPPEVFRLRAEGFERNAFGVELPQRQNA